MSLSDVEKGSDDDETHTLIEMNDAQQREEAEEKRKEEKERLELQDSIAVLVAFIIIIAGSVGIVVVKNLYFQDTHNHTFTPLQQEVKYN